MRDTALKRQVEETCKKFRFWRVHDFFLAAFEKAFGKRRGIRKEARHAASKFATTGSITDRARAAIMKFIAFLATGLAPATAG